MYPTKILLYFINFVSGLVELLIGARILLKLFGANSATPFVNWVYEVSRTLIYPFQGIFPSPVLDGRFILEMSAVVALLIYALITYLITEFIRFISFQSTSYYTRTGKAKVIHENN